VNEILADQLHIGPGILRDQDLVASLDGDRLDRSARERLAAADRDDHNFERLLPGVIGDEQAAGRPVRFAEALGEDTVVKDESS
jgi:hypothetical protein